MAVERPLRARLLIALTAGVLLFGSLNVGLVGRIAHDALRSEQDRRLVFAARLLAQRAVRPLLVDDRLDLHKLLEESRSLDPDLAFLAVYGPHGERLAASGGAEALGEIDVRLRAGGAGAPSRYREAIEPILGGQLGEVHVGVEEAHLRAVLGRIVATIAAMVLAFLGAGVVAAALLARSVTRPIEQLVRFASAFRLEGSLPPLEVKGRDEVAALAEHMERSARHLQELHADSRRREREMSRVEHLATVGMLAAGAAHEINNPLAGIRTSIERLLRQLPDQGAAERYGAVLRDAVARIERAVRGMLGFARAAEVVPRPMLLPEAVERAFTLAAPRLEEQRVGLSQDFPADLGPVSADPSQLTQVVLNLVLNACDAIPHGGQIRVTARRDGSEVALTVSDSGPGVPPEMTDRIFDPFFTTKPTGKGTGLGLAVSRAAVREMGGELHLLPAGGGGAVFEIRLPVVKGEADGQSASG
ncbi:MAG: HAMP domain-containing protein [Thermoanaerobaculia bacterium]|nr:HAMP domain-containing protein [Thermoanaerobaculia bacterium]